ncbi:MAG: Na+/H+ antiporter NhaA [Leptospiraceae bacterium]|nr:Na+/H+ antiporter NhaA [Leptospiraceae bacterium]
MRQFSAFLLGGTALALLWSNLNHEAYHRFVYTVLESIPGMGHGGGPLEITFHFLVNDFFMALFFGMAMKEVSESFLPGGALSSFRKAALPALATLGGVIGPVVLFFILKAIFPPIIDGQEVDITRAWAVPTATDIAYSWLFASFVFGAKHPAVTFLLVLAVLDDLIGMAIIAFFYSSNVHPEYLGFVLLAMLIAEGMRRKRVRSFWPYVIIAGPISWIGLHFTGVHAALALVPVVPFMPHASRDLGMFAEMEEGRHDTMNEFEHYFKPLVDVGLLTFGLANAGVYLKPEAFQASPTWIIFTSLVVGKTFGIYLFSRLGIFLGLSLPTHMKLSQQIVLGCVAGIGFTVALFVTDVATRDMPNKEVADMLKLGALMSFLAGPIAIHLGRLFKVEKIHS